jgi:hypothetical protein
MGMKLSHSHLETIKKTLENNNKLLKGLTSTDSKIGSVAKQIKVNEKQIKILTDEYYID